VALANDYEVVVAGLASMLLAFAARIEIIDFLLVSHGDDEPRAPVDVLLFDTFGRVGLGLDAIGTFLEDPIVSHVAIYTWQHAPALVDEALRRGVSACLSKTTAAPDLVTDIERIARGEVVVAPHFGGRLGAGAPDWPGRTAGLTPRESEVLALLAAGHRNAEIAAALVITLDTVKTHLRTAYRKLGVTNRAQAVAAVLTDPAFTNAAPRRARADR
jgi:DNA-binding NarL/FixJ family response regulator